MNVKFPVLVIGSLALSLALVLGLVATLAPNAGAQDGGTASDITSQWMRHNIPTTQDLQTGCCGNAVVNGITQKRCGITILPGCPQPGPDAVIGTEPAGFPVTQITLGGDTRWFCGGFY